MDKHAPTLPPPVAMLQLSMSFGLTRMIYVATKFGIADLIHEQPRSADELAAATNLHARSLYRILRALAGVGIFMEDEAGIFQQTSMSETMRRDGPGSMRAMILTQLAGEHAEAFMNLEESVRTGQTVMQVKQGRSVWQHFADNPERAAIFNEAMTNMSAAETDAVVAAYDFSSSKKLVDVAGGHGSLLAGILTANPHLQGVLFDQPSVVEGSGPILADVADRVEVVGGDMFEQVPSGGDAYIMKHIIHDWYDEQALTILKNCHRAMADNGKVLIVELVIPPGNEPHFGKILDIVMLAVAGGCERTAAEYEVLLAKAGFKLTRIIPTEGPASVVEAVKL